MESFWNLEHLMMVRPSHGWRASCQPENGSVDDGRIGQLDGMTKAQKVVGEGSWQGVRRELPCLRALPGTYRGSENWGKLTGPTGTRTGVRYCKRTHQGQVAVDVVGRPKLQRRPSHLQLGAGLWVDTD